MTRSTRTRTVALTTVGLTAALVAGAAWVLPAGADERAAAALAPAAAIEGYAVTASAEQVDVGDTLTLTVATTAASDLYAYDLGVTFDPAVLAYDDGSARAEGTGSTYDAAGVGQVHLVHTALGSSPATTGSTTLGTLSFTAIGGGATDLAVDELVLVDSTTAETTLTDVGTTPVTVVAAATPTTSPTPTPTAPTTTPAPVPTASPAPVAVKARVARPRAGTPAKATLTFSAGAAGAVKVRYAGAVLKKAKPVRSGTVRVTLPAQRKGTYTLVVVLTPTDGSPKVRRTSKVVVRG